MHLWNEIMMNKKYFYFDKIGLLNALVELYFYHSTILSRYTIPLLKQQSDRQINLLAGFQTDSRQTANPIPQHGGMMSRCLSACDSGGTSQSIPSLLTELSERNDPFERLRQTTKYSYYAVYKEALCPQKSVAFQPNSLEVFSRPHIRNTTPLRYVNDEILTS